MVTRAGRARRCRRRVDLPHLARARCAHAISRRRTPTDRSSATGLWMDPRALRPRSPVLRRRRPRPGRGARARSATRDGGRHQPNERWRRTTTAGHSSARLSLAARAAVDRELAPAGRSATPSSRFDQFVIGDSQPPRARRRADGRRDARPGLQPPVHLRPPRRRQDPPAAARSRACCSPTTRG